MPYHTSPFQLGASRYDNDDYLVWEMWEREKEKAWKRKFKKGMDEWPDALKVHLWGYWCIYIAIFSAESVSWSI